MSDLANRLRAILGEHAPRIPEGEDLASWVASAPDSLVAVLGSLDPDRAERAGQLLVEVGADAVPTLQRAEENASGKSTRKAYRRALHKLRSGGAPVSLARKGVRGRLPSVSEGEPEQALLGPVGPRGERMVVLTATAGGSPALFQILASHEEGIQRVDVSPASRATVRSAMKSLRGREEAHLVSAPPGAVRELLRRLLRLGTRPEGQERRALEAAVALSEPEGPGRTPGELIRERLADRPMSQAIAAIELRRRIERGRIPPSILTGDAVEEAAARLHDADQSRLVLSAAQTRDRRAAVLESLATFVLGQETRERLAVRLEEGAWILHAGGDTDGARAALATAEAIRTADRPDRVEFLGLVLELSLRAATRNTRESGRGPLIVPGR